MKRISILLLVMVATTFAQPKVPEVSDLPPFDHGGKYLDQYEMGLYPEGKSAMPEAHRKAGERIAATIKPLDAEGKVDEREGRILALVLGHSNCKQYFTALEQHLKKNPDQLHPRFEVVNAAIGGQQLPEIRRLKGSVWDLAAKLTSRPGYSAKQVQVLFLHTTYHGWKNERNTPPRPFPETMKQMQADLAAVLEHAVKSYPNLRIAYLTADGNRRFTGFEPHVWQEAFAFKWLIEAQIKGDEGTSFEGEQRRLPWLSWGPYIWDGSWDQSFFSDGVHPSPKARAIFVEKYWETLKNDPVARPWMWKQQ